MANLESLTSSFASLFMRLHRLADRRMAEQGASLARTKVLLFVRKHGGTARAADIAECFNQAPRTITEAIDALEREGLLRRTPDPSDRRVKRIAITAEGEAAVAATEPLRVQLIDQLFGALDAGEQQQFAAMLDKLATRMDELEG